MAQPSRMITVKDYPIPEDIVISGIGGRFPEADTMDEFASKLYSGEDMVTCDDRRWPIGLFLLNPNYSEQLHNNWIF